MSEDLVVVERLGQVSLLIFLASLPLSTDYR